MFRTVQNTSWSLLLCLVACEAEPPGSPSTTDSTPDQVVTDSDVDTGAVLVEPPAPLACDDVGEGWCELGPSSGLGEAVAHGRGMLVADFNNDGWDDVFDCNSGYSVGGPERSKLYMNKGDGRFYVADAHINPEHTHDCFGLAAGDYDGDGDLDVAVFNGGYFGDRDLRLLRNDFATKGGFTEVSRPSGFPREPRNWWQGVWADINGDTCLDLVATARTGRPALLMGSCRGAFTDQAHVRGIDVVFDPGTGDNDEEDGKNPVLFDYDSDGDLDLFIPSDTDRNVLYNNDGRGMFTDVTRQAFPEPDVVWSDTVTSKDDAAIFAVSVDDFNQDGWPDLYFGRYYKSDIVALNQHDGTFVFHGTDVGLDEAPNPEGGYTIENTMGSTVADIDGNGWPDAVVGTGTPDVGSIDLVFCNQGPDGSGAPFRFERCSSPFVTGHGEQRTHGVALTDIDHDGRRDIIWNFGGFPVWDLEFGVATDARNYVYRDNRPDAPNTASLRLYGTRGDREAIGARVKITTPDATHYQFVTTAQGFQSTSTRMLMLPLGTHEQADVEVRWLNGDVSTLTIRQGERLTLQQPGGTVDIPVLPAPAEAGIEHDAYTLWRDPAQLPKALGPTCGGARVLAVP